MTTTSDGGGDRLPPRFRDSTGKPRPVDTVYLPGDNAYNRGNCMWTRADRENLRRLTEVLERLAKSAVFAPVPRDADADADDDAAEFDDESWTA